MNEERILEVLEPLRKKRNWMLILIPVTFFGFCMIDILLTVKAERGGIAGSEHVEGSGGILSIGIVLILIIAFIVWACKFSNLTKEYTNSYKKLIASQTLKECFEESSYFPEQGFSPEEFQKAKLIYWRSDFRYSSEDFIVGVSQNVPFRQSDIRITHTTGSGKSRRTVVDVDGRLTQFVYPKDIKSRILIVKRGFHAMLDVDCEKIELEDVDFNKKFAVYAKDPHSVYYLLTPPMMEYIKNLYNADSAVYISFDGENLYILRSGRGGIFVPPFGKLDVEKEIQKSKRELNEINHIIEILKL